MSNGCFLICATCDTYQQVKDDLKCYNSPPNNESKLLMPISDYITEFVCGYANCVTFW